MAVAAVSEVLETDRAKEANEEFRLGLEERLVCEVQFAFPPTWS